MAVLYYNDENAYSRNRALEMSYLNRLIIEENMQFECYGILDPVSIIPAETSNYITHLLNCLLRRIEAAAIVHVIISDDFGLKSYNKVALRRFGKFLKSLWRVWPKEIMITRIGSQRLECVQKEQYQKFYRNGSQVNTTIQTNYFDGGVDVSKYETVVFKSIGDDIEDFYNHIKMNQIFLINRTEEKTYLTTVMLQQIFSLDPSSSSKLIVRTFHLSMLTDQEESEMDKICITRGKDISLTTDDSLPDENLVIFSDEELWILGLGPRPSDQIGRSDKWRNLQEQLRKQGQLRKLEQLCKQKPMLLKHEKFTNETAIYTNEENYALALCARKTFYIKYDSHNQKRILFDIDELDALQGRILKSYQDSDSDTESE